MRTPVALPPSSHGGAATYRASPLQHKTFEERLAEEAERFREAAAELSPGAAQELLFEASTADRDCLTHEPVVELKGSSASNIRRTAMPDYRAYIMGTYGHVQNRVDLQSATMMSNLSGSPNRPLMVTTLSYGIWIDTSTHSGNGRAANTLWQSITACDAR